VVLSLRSILDPDGAVAVRTIPAREAVWADLPASVPDAIRNGLAGAGIRALYGHQAEAVAHIMDGRHTVVTTSTSSGKSLIYTLPVFRAFLSDPDTVALYLTPAKALGQDQARGMRELADRINWPPWTGAPVIDVCDGDTPPARRSEILEQANIVVTTLDLLHYTLLPRHARHGRLFAGLRFVIVDEAHIYRGVFGNHVCHVLRRLRRVCRHYGAEPVFVLTTATIGNPAGFAHNLTGLDFAVVDRDTSPSGKREMVFYEPQTRMDRNGNPYRPPAHFEAARAMGALIANGCRVIVFGRSRRVVEMMYRRVTDEYPTLAGALTPYKGTYTPETRRRMEAELFGGKLKGVVATNALELGIDVGDLDVCVMAGFPGSISSTWQQAGRAGRKGQDSMILLIANEDPLETFMIRNPDYFFAQPSEKAVVDPDKMQFLAQHLLMAGRELPLSREDAAFWGEKTYFRAINFLRRMNSIAPLESDAGRTYRTTADYVRFGLRGEKSTYRVVAPDGRTLEEYDYTAVLAGAYPGAIIPVMGNDHLVTSVDLAGKLVLTVPLPKRLAGYRTQPILNVALSEATGDAANDAAGVPARAGTVTVTTTLMGYYLVAPDGVRTESAPANPLPPLSLRTTGLWLELKGAHYGVLHTVAHLLQVVVPWLVMCERRDLDSFVDGPGGRVFLYDAYEGGVGLAESALDAIGEVLGRAFEILADCGCVEGCPACVQIPQCRERNDFLDKPGTAALLAKTLGRPVPDHLRPDAPAPARGRAGGEKMAPTPLVGNLTDLRLAARAFERQAKKR